MRHFTTLSLSLFLCLPLTIFANTPQADTIGMRVSRTHRTAQTTVYVEQHKDSIVSIDSTGINKITIVTHDTIRSSENTNRIDTTYLIARPPANPWTLVSQFEVSVNQTSQSKYWSGGNTFSIFFSNQSEALYVKGFSRWRTTLDWRYGMEHRDRGQDVNPWLKREDRYALVSTYGFRASPLWNYSGLFEFNSQLSRSFQSATNQTIISRFLSPARFTFSLGMEYVSIPAPATPALRMFFSPLAFRATYVMDTTLSTRFDVPAGQHWAASFGPLIRLNNRHQLTKDILLRSRFESFANILAMHDPFVRVEWQVNFDIKVNRYLTLGFEPWFIYDPTEWFDKLDSDGKHVLDEDGKRVRIRSARYRQRFVLTFTYRITN